LSQVEQIGEENYRQIFLPLYFKWDTGDDLLDPTRGGRLFLQVMPFFDVTGSDSDFIKGYARYRHYIPVLKKPLLTLAGKVSIGVIEGSGLVSIPADERFYAGGGGSIRGYAYQSVGPLVAGDPIGGQSLIELSAEVRVKLTDHLGLVGFLDGGSAFADTIPDSSQDLRWGSGAGLRYFTPIGPLRFDVAVPLNRRPEIDDSFQIYISLGQAF
jgi:translocation and assembly module TamA